MEIYGNLIVKTGCLLVFFYFSFSLQMTKKLILVEVMAFNLNDGLEKHFSYSHTVMTNNQVGM